MVAEEMVAVPEEATEVEEREEGPEAAMGAAEREVARVEARARVARLDAVTVMEGWAAATARVAFQEVP